MSARRDVDEATAQGLVELAGRLVDLAGRLSDEHRPVAASRAYALRELAVALRGAFHGDPRDDGWLERYNAVGPAAFDVLNRAIADGVVEPGGVIRAAAFSDNATDERPFPGAVFVGVDYGRIAVIALRHLDDDAKAWLALAASEGGAE